MISHTHFKFCPLCASDKIDVHMKNAIKCAACGYVYFHDTAAAVAGIVEIEGKVLLVKRAHEPKAGFYDLPGGFVDYKENLEQALVREIREECGIEVKNLRYFGSFANVYHYHDVEYFTADAFFLCSPADVSKLSMSDECSGYLIVEPQKIELDTIAFDSIRSGIRKYRDARK
jgi:ADP-ribose pyrophosphatase YjhB (NUDIX family)